MALGPGRIGEKNVLSIGGQGRTGGSVSRETRWALEMAKMGAVEGVQHRGGVRKHTPWGEHFEAF